MVKKPTYKELERRVVELEIALSKKNSSLSAKTPKGGIQVEVELLKSEEKLRMYIDNAPYGIFVVDSNQKYVDVNKAACQMTGYSKEELLKKTTSQLVPANFKSTVPFDTLKTIGKIESEILFKKKDGTVFPSLLKAVALSENRFMAFCSDLTNVKETEEQIRQSDKKYQTLFNNMSLGMSYLEAVYNNKDRMVDCRYLDANAKYLNYINHKSKNDVLNRLVSEVLPGTEDEWFRFFEPVAKSGKVVQEELFNAPSGRWYSTIGYRPKGERDTFVGIFEDITERKLAEKKLKESEDRYRNLFEQSPEAIWLIGLDGIILDFNHKISFSGIKREKMIGKHFSILGLNFSEASPEVLFERLVKGNIDPFELEIKTSTEDNLWVLVYLGVGEDPDKKYLRITIQDITKRKKAELEKIVLEEQLKRSQRLETIGTLAGGIAHDFNNILTPILGYSEMALGTMCSTDSLYEDLKAIKKGGMRAKELVEQILTFSRQIEKEWQPVQLQEILNEVIKLLRPIIPVNIKINLQIDPSCSKVFADPGQLHQLIMNLCTNSYQAMEETGGTLTLELKELLVDRKTVKSNPNLKEKKYVSLSVNDTGIGIDETTIDRIFEPFFTTKPVDKGTGMGLSVVHGIVRSHHGDITVRSQLKKGSTFQIFLPVFSRQHQNVENETKVVLEGSESILIVDDEEVITRMLKKMLTRLGYSVRIRKNGIEALRVFKKHSDEIDLIISDLTMPDMSGLELSEKLHKVKKKLPFILITGFGHKLSREVQKQYGINKILGKPIVLQKLASAIRKIFDTKD